jgi:hypothetical protein
VWLQTQVRNAKLAQVGICLLVIAAVAAGLIYNRRYFENYFAGPYDISKAEVLGASSAENLPRYWVHLTPDQIVDSHIDHVTVRKKYGIERSRSVTGHYWIAVIGDRLMFVEAKGPAPSSGQALTGAIVDPADDVRQHLMGSLKPEYASNVLPVMLEGGRFQSDGELGLAAAGLLGGGALIWGLFSIMGVVNPRNDRALKALEASGVPLADVDKEIAEDVAARRYLKVGSWKLCRDYLVRSGMRFDIRPTRDLLWANLVTVQRRMYGVIPTGKSHQMVLYFADRKITEGLRSEDAAEDAVRALAIGSPWTFLGYSAELERAWNRQRRELIDAVAQRRAAALEQRKTREAAASEAPLTVEPAAAQPAHADSDWALKI